MRLTESKVYSGVSGYFAAKEGQSLPNGGGGGGRKSFFPCFPTFSLSLAVFEDLLSSLLKLTASVTLLWSLSLRIASYKISPFEIQGEGICTPWLHSPRFRFIQQTFIENHNPKLNNFLKPILIFIKVGWGVRVSLVKTYWKWKDLYRPRHHGLK